MRARGWHRSCYPFIPMTNHILDEKNPLQSAWVEWDQFLQRWGVKEFAAAFLDAAGPMNLFLTQMLHFAGPFLRLITPADRWASLADTLEDQQQSRAFTSFLRSKENA